MLWNVFAAVQLTLAERIVEAETCKLSFRLETLENESLQFNIVDGGQ